MAIPLEDNFTDIIGKAQSGLGISDSQLAKKSAVSIQQIRKIRGGDLDQDAICAVAPVLGLDPESLLEVALGKWKPETLPSIDGLAQFTTPYHDVTVNAYLAWDRASREAVAFVFFFKQKTAYEISASILLACAWRNAFSSASRAMR